MQHINELPVRAEFVRVHESKVKVHGVRASHNSATKRIISRSYLLVYHGAATSSVVYCEIVAAGKLILIVPSKR